MVRTAAEVPHDAVGAVAAEMVEAIMGWVVEEDRAGTPTRLMMRAGEGSLHIPGHLIHSVRHALEVLELAYIEEKDQYGQIAGLAGVSEQVAKTVLESTGFAKRDYRGLWRLKS